MTTPTMPGPSRVTRPDWRHAALCTQVDPELFFPELGARQEAAKAVCARCPAQGECRAWALAHREPYGVWGGLNPEDRRRTRAAHRALAASPAGAGGGR